jgi:hypothetical protein
MGDPERGSWMAQPKVRTVRTVEPGSFEPEEHYYPRVLNAQIHALPRFFLSLSNERILRRYSHLNPGADREALAGALSYQPRHFRWSGCDLAHVTTDSGARQMTLIETNSCPSGQKSMPLYEEHEEQGGYRSVLEHTFRPHVTGKRMPAGGLAVLYDKNPMEASGYAAAMADMMNEPVKLTPFHDDDTAPPARFVDGVLQVRDEGGHFSPIRCCFRYVTQRPWNRIPLSTKTIILNPIVACLAGGRNKAVAAAAYARHNRALEGTGLSIRTPTTVCDLPLSDVRRVVEELGGHAVIKDPYANAGQGIYTITSEAELRRFEQAPHRYERFLVQSLIGNYQWTSRQASGSRLFHVGTIPNKTGASYVFDLRFMISAGPQGFRPLAIYARRARSPLCNALPEGESSWSILGTNLSARQPDGTWATEMGRLLLVDRKDFNLLGLGIDDLIEAYLQTVLATIAIDQMAAELITPRGQLRMKLLQSLNPDPVLLNEIQA